MSKPGRFIVFEGPDGAGKSTVAEAITKWLNEDIVKTTVLARSPGGTQFANAMRSIVFSGATKSHQAEAMGLMTAEVDCFESLILPNLAAGHHVIGDRWVMSGRIYQGFMRNRPIESIDNLIDASIPHPRGTPDLHIVLTAEPEVLLKRAIQSMDQAFEKKVEEDKKTPAKKATAKKTPAKKTAAKKTPAKKTAKEEMAMKYEAEREALEGNLDYFKCVWAAYQKPMTFSGGSPCVVIDTTDKTPEQVAQKVREIVQQAVLSI